MGSENSCVLDIATQAKENSDFKSASRYYSEYFHGEEKGNYHFSLHDSINLLNYARCTIETNKNKDKIDRYEIEYVERQLEEAKIAFESDLYVIPSSWLTETYQMLNECKMMLKKYDDAVKESKEELLKFKSSDNISNLDVLSVSFNLACSLAANGKIIEASDVLKKNLNETSQELSQLAKEDPTYQKAIELKDQMQDKLNEILIQIKDASRRIKTFLSNEEEEDDEQIIHYNDDIESNESDSSEENDDINVIETEIFMEETVSILPIRKEIESSSSSKGSESSESESSTNSSDSDSSSESSDSD